MATAKDVPDVVVPNKPSDAMASDVQEQPAPKRTFLLSYEEYLRSLSEEKAHDANHTDTEEASKT